MARPKSKEELIHQSNENYQKLIETIESLSIEKQNQAFPDKYMNRCISDVLYHLHQWHLMFLEWYEVGMKGEKPDMPAKGYSWKDTPALNKLIHAKYSGKNISGALTNFKKSHARVQQLIESHTNEELFEKKRYKWTGTTSVGQYLVSATSSHYDWAFKLIKKALVL